MMSSQLFLKDKEILDLKEHTFILNDELKRFKSILSQNDLK